MKFTRTEADIQRAILAHCNRLPGVTLFRVNSGAVTATYKGKRRFLRFTGMPGISDLIGWRSERALFERMMFGQDQNKNVSLVRPVAQWLAIEVKRPDNRKPTSAQAAFLNLVREAGGLAIVATSVQDVIDALR